MKLDAVGITSSNMKQTIKFYSLLGFEFPKDQENEGHIEPVTSKGSARLMIDKKEIVKNIIEEDPKPGNHSTFAIQYDTPKEIDSIVEKLKGEGFKIVKEPWDAFWGQRYAVVEDPDRYRVDLYSYIQNK
jgi:catechol 2,3-dioxygenase-like lactoylglutathione lyase family enzyme